MTIAALVDPDVARAPNASRRCTTCRLVLPSADRLDRTRRRRGAGRDARVSARAGLDRADEPRPARPGREADGAHARRRAQRMVAAARDHGVVLTVGLFRRLLPAIRLFRAALDAGQIGDLLNVTAEVGDAYTWQLTTLAGMRREEAGGGMLVDMGSHVLDLLLYICDAHAARWSSTPTTPGTGIETDCTIELGLSAARIVRAGARRVEPHAHARQHDPRRRARAAPSNGSSASARGCWSTRRRRFVDTLTASAARVRHRSALGRRAGAARVRRVPRADRRLRAAPSHGDRAGAVVGRVGAAERRADRRVLRAADAAGRAVVHRAACRRASSPAAAGRRRHARARDRRERLHRLPAQRAAALRVGLARPGADSQPRAARCGWRACRSSSRIGDLASPADLAQALEGCDAVVHAGIGTSWRESERVAINVKGTRNLVDAALRAGVKRFVHISTIALYGERVDRHDHRRHADPSEEGLGLRREQVRRRANRPRGGRPRVCPPSCCGRRGRLRSAQHDDRHPAAAAPGAEPARSSSTADDVPSNTIYVDNLCDGIQLALDGAPERQRRRSSC